MVPPQKISITANAFKIVTHFPGGNDNGHDGDGKHPKRGLISHILNGDQLQLPVH